MDAEDDHVQFACAYEATHVEEAAELESIVSQLVDAGGDPDAEKLFNRYHHIVCLNTISCCSCRGASMMPDADWVSLVCLQLAKYHEQAQLLDPHILGVVGPLSAQLRQHAAPGEEEAPLACVLITSRFLWDLVTIR